MRTMSIVGKGTHTDEHVVAYLEQRRPYDLFGQSGSLLGRLLGLAVRIDRFRHPRVRSRADGGPA